MSLLDVSDLSVHYGRVAALTKVDVAVREGQIVTVLGANGAGKSTLLKAILGLEPAKSGGVTFDDDDLTALSPNARIRRGVLLVPEGRRVLISLTVEENLLLGAHLRRDDAGIRRDVAAIYERFPNLADRRRQSAAGLSGGEQQMLAIGRAMMARPRLLMLDEPSLGLSPLFVSKIFELLVELNRDGLSILLVEQNAGRALEIAHHAVVLELGRVTMAGDPKVLAGDPRLQEAYLGAEGGTDVPAAAHDL